MGEEPDRCAEGRRSQKRSVHTVKSRCLGRGGTGPFPAPIAASRFGSTQTCCRRRLAFERGGIRNDSSIRIPSRSACDREQSFGGVACYASGAYQNLSNKNMKNKKSTSNIYKNLVIIVAFYFYFLKPR